MYISIFNTSTLSQLRSGVSGWPGTVSVVEYAAEGHGDGQVPFLHKNECICIYIHTYLCIYIYIYIDFELETS